MGKKFLVFYVFEPSLWEIIEASDEQEACQILCFRRNRGEGDEAYSVDDFKAIEISYSPSSRFEYCTLYLSRECKKNVCCRVCGENCMKPCEERTLKDCIYRVNVYLLLETSV